MISREVTQGPQLQGEDEKIVYSITTTPWGSNPTSISVVVKDRGTVVTSTVMPTGSASVVGDVITLPKLQALTAGHIYRVEIKFDAQGDTFEPYFYVRAQT